MGNPQSLHTRVLSLKSHVDVLKTLLLQEHPVRTAAVMPPRGATVYQTTHTHQCRQLQQLERQDGYCSLFYSKIEGLGATEFVRINADR